MLIDWLKLLSALVLLLTPAGLLHDRRVRYRPISRDWTDHWAQILSFGLHAIDLVRAALGMWLLVEALHSAPGVRGLLRYGVIATQGAAVTVALALQTLVCREPDSANAPFAFLTGLVLGYLPPVIAGFALVTTVVIVLGVRSPAAFFPILALLAPGMGLLFTGRQHLLILVVTACAALVPWLLSLLFSRELVVSYRARRRNDSRAPIPQSPLR